MTSGNGVTTALIGSAFAAILGWGAYITHHQSDLDAKFAVLVEKLDALTNQLREAGLRSTLKPE
jgi:hypothetical protein